MNFRLLISGSCFLLLLAAISLSKVFPRANACHASATSGFSRQETVAIPYRFAAVIVDLVFSPKDRLLAATMITPDWYGPGIIKVWQYDEATDSISLLLHEFETRSHHLALSPDGQWLVGAEYGGKPTIESIGIIEVWNLETGKQQYRLNGYERDFGGVKTIGITPDSEFLITGSNFLEHYDEIRGHNLQIWDLQTGTLEASLGGHPDAVTALAISPNGQLLASAGRTKVNGEKTNIHLWDLETRTVIRTLETDTEEVSALLFTPDGKSLISGSKDHKIRLWEVQTGQLTQVLVGHHQPVDQLAVSDDGKQLISRSRHESIRMWDLQTGKQDQLITEGIGMTFAFSSETEQLITTDYRYSEQDNYISTWENDQEHPFQLWACCHLNLLCR